MSVEVLIKDLIKTNFAVSTDDGNQVFDIVNKNLSKKESIILDFKGISLMTTAFLNAAIGQLYSNKDFSSEFLNSNLKLQNVPEQDKALFGMVVKRAKEYFANKESFERNTNDSMYGHN
ncbi:STAS-like domain-containing protein [Gramella sp. GC03-9]|uniref:STAS-like domain-containing protein n=1 Tax=Christiangramia oceanisediminis TaxID=2920386 RepID=A0A9X2KYQ5_9FLAO|nr:STAS-like domain-containing protein [Gramella oceanisediminis]MCP9200551.1 STAS-like domain-containing protein [Gramella oceanisediminis]